MNEYVGCKINRLSKKSILMYQDPLTKKMLKIFGSELTNMRKYETPANTGYIVVRPSGGGT